jgi:hypothetical protein
MFEDVVVMFCFIFKISFPIHATLFGPFISCEINEELSKDLIGV